MELGITAGSEVNVPSAASIELEVPYSSFLLGIYC
jgi:hypothetical protein